MSLKIRELIKKVRACKTAEEERSVINKESAEIRNMGKEITDSIKCRNLAKCIFMHMLGYPTTFIHMTCVNLLASPKFNDKRVAYVALCVLMDEKSEVLLLTSHTIKKDLENSNQYIVSTALNAIGEVCTSDMCRDSAPDVLKLLSSPNPFIKKKAALALSKIIRKCPELTDTVAEKLNMIFEDKNHGVLLGGLSLASQIFKNEPQYIDKYRKYLNNMMRMMKTLSSTNYAPEYDINGITDPFLQVKLLETLSHFGRNNSDASEEMNDLLASISTNTESNKNTGNAVLYELVRTIIAIESNSGLKSLGSTILGKFLTHKDNNYKYIALNTLQDVAKIDLNSVQKHKNTILDCLKDTDISIKRRSLDLIYLIINSSNIKQIIKECLNFLLVAENEFKYELTTKLCQSLEKYSPSIKWQIDTLIKMLCLAGNFVSDEIASSIINLIISTEELHIYSVHKIFIAMKSNMSQEALIKVGIYILGELGDLLINHSVTGPDEETINVTEEDMISHITEINNRKYSSDIKEYLMNCFMKLITKLSPKAQEELKFLLDQESKSYNCEVQQRAVEYLVLTNVSNQNLKQEIMKNVPNSKIVKESEIKKELTIDEYDNDADEKTFSLNIKVDRNSLNTRANNTNNTSNGPVNLVSSNSASGQSSNKPVSLIDDFTNIFGSGAATQTIQTSNINNIFGFDNTPVLQNTNSNIPNAGGNNKFDLLSGILNFDNNAHLNQNNPNVNPTSSPNINNNLGLNLLNLNQPLQNQASSAVPNSNDLLNSLGLLYNNPSSISNNAANPINNFSNNFGSLTAPQLQASQMSGLFNLGNMQAPSSVQNNNSVPLMGMGGYGLNSYSTSSEPGMKQVFRNNEITMYTSFNKNNENINGSLYVSNNIMKHLKNLKVNFMVPKYVNLKVLNTTGAALEPNQGLGVKKDVSIINNDVTKKVILKVKYSYTVDEAEITDTITIDDL